LTNCFPSTGTTSIVLPCSLCMTKTKRWTSYRRRSFGLFVRGIRFATNPVRKRSCCILPATTYSTCCENVEVNGRIKTRCRSRSFPPARIHHRAHRFDQPIATVDETGHRPALHSRTQRGTNRFGLGVVHDQSESDTTPGTQETPGAPAGSQL
jgi:hypothetical protein